MITDHEEMKSIRVPNFVDDEICRRRFDLRRSEYLARFVGKHIYLD